MLPVRYVVVIAVSAAGIEAGGVGRLA